MVKYFLLIVTLLAPISVIADDVPEQCFEASKNCPDGNVIIDPIEQKCLDKLKFPSIKVLYITCFSSGLGVSYVSSYKNGETITPIPKDVDLRLKRAALDNKRKENLKFIKTMQDLDITPNKEFLDLLKQKIDWAEQEKTRPAKDLYQMAMTVYSQPDIPHDLKHLTELLKFEYLSMAATKGHNLAREEIKRLEEKWEKQLR